MVKQSSNADVFQAISCPTRRTLLRLIAERERSVTELVEAMQITQPSVSEQLRVLRDTGLVEAQRSGRSRIYQLNPQGLAPLVDWLSEFSRFWDVKLDALSAFLERQHREPSK